ncbi:MFS transporter [Actinokineospora inagensis]|uniref:MFS transporter n=1 Tax=Actinokineospora inagensis TaxID=103730 RepID=UPI00040D34F6|nr:MFS transporter [Actinokineospora inagensis]
MLSPYRRIFATPGAVAFTAAGFVARLPMAMFSVSTVIMVATRYHSFALAGAVSAAGLVAVAAGSPFIGRLVDRLGQARVALPATLISAASSTVTIICAHNTAPVWTIFVTYVVSAGVPFVSAMARARWAHVLADDPDGLHVANSFERVVDEVCLVGGPILATLLSTLVFPEAGLLAATVLMVVGTVLFAAQKRTEPPVERHESGAKPKPPVRVPGVQVILVTFLAIGVILGSLEVVTIGFADSLGHKSSAGFALALLAAGSAVSGVVFGLLRPNRGAAVRYLAGVAVLGLAMVPLLLVDNLVLLGAWLAVTGVVVSPTMVTSMTLLQEVVPAKQINEGVTLTESALIVGISIGAASGGWVVQHVGAAAGYRVPVVAGLVAFAVALVGARKLLSAPALQSTGGAR